MKRKTSRESFCNPTDVTEAVSECRYSSVPRNGSHCSSLKSNFHFILTHEANHRCPWSRGRAAHSQLVPISLGKTEQSELASPAAVSPPGLCSSPPCPGHTTRSPRWAGAGLCPQTPALSTHGACEGSARTCTGLSRLCLDLLRLLQLLRVPGTVRAALGLRYFIANPARCRARRSCARSQAAATSAP